MEIFTVVIVGAVVLFAVIGVVSWLTGASIYDQIGEGGLSDGSGGRGSDVRNGSVGAAAGAAGHALQLPTDSPSARAEREIEIRQMLQASSERRVRRGEQALDIDAEVARLQAADSPSSSPGEGASEGGAKRDAGLVEEVRQLVLARNERRARRGEPPLDVEAEVERTLDELEP